MTRTAVALFSGGLDSSLSVCVVKAQGVRVVAFHLVSAFCRVDELGGTHPDIVAAAEELGIELHTENSSADMIGMVLEPQFGFGKNMNPCIDCRINTILRAEAFRQRIGADFLISGEVLGQRPMSQNRNAMQRIDKATSLGELLLRPLSARMLDPTLPEREGWIDRGALPHIAGRSRKPQLALAREFNISKYGDPAGGCLLTDAQYCRRLRAFIDERRARGLPEADLLRPDDLLLLRVGRHFSAAPGIRIISGRMHEENLALERLCSEEDLLFQATPRGGSVSLLQPAPDAALKAARSAGKEEILPAEHFDSPAIRAAAGLAVYYSKYREAGQADIEVRPRVVPYREGPVLKSVRMKNPDDVPNVVTG